MVLPPKLPASGVIVLPAQTVCGDPAFTVAIGFTVMTTVDVAAGQGPAGSLVVKVNVTVPLVIDGV